MANGYTRQSSLQIVDGQTAHASDFNNEYDAIKNALDGTTGHDHSGGVGLGPKINLTATVPGVTGTLDAQFGGIHTAAGAPGTTNCTPNYVRGCIWINTTTSDAYVCIDDTLNAAVWQRLPAGTITGATTVPTTANDNTQGFRVGSIIVNTTQSQAYLATSVATGAAVWTAIMQGRATASTSDPAVTDDNTTGQTAGSIWTNTSTGVLFIALSVATGAASWTRVSSDEGQAVYIASIFAL